MTVMLHALRAHKRKLGYHGRDCTCAPEHDGGTPFMDTIFPYICIAAAAFVTTYILVPVVKRLAKRLDAVDYPSKRRINTEPIPRMGGLAVLAALPWHLPCRSWAPGIGAGRRRSFRTPA